MYPTHLYKHGVFNGKAWEDIVDTSNPWWDGAEWTSYTTMIHYCDFYFADAANPSGRPRYFTFYFLLFPFALLTFYFLPFAPLAFSNYPFPQFIILTINKLRIGTAKTTHFRCHSGLISASGTSRSTCLLGWCSAILSCLICARGSIQIQHTTRLITVWCLPIIHATHRWDRSSTPRFRPRLGLRARAFITCRFRSES